MSLNGEKKRRTVMRNRNPANHCQVTIYTLLQYFPLGQSHIPAPNPVQKHK
jgi:hypothetical protein